MKFAADKSLRRIDQFGRLHVANNHISKATINGYLGSEIPDHESLGLDPNRIYQLYRDPEELAKAAPTFNNIPILSKHVPISADDPQKDLVIGATGDNAEFVAPYLDNSIVIWTAPAIAGIETKEYCEISCCYAYRADMTPGELEGVAFDGVMRDIIGNHVAIVDIGRAGPDVLVADRHNPELDQMKNKPLSRRGLVLRTALAASLRPILAADAAMPNLSAILAGVTAANMDKMKPKIIAAVTKGLDGKLAKDANMCDLAGVIDQFKDDPESAAMDDDMDTDMSADASMADQIIEAMGDKLTDEQKTKIRAAFDKPADEPVSAAVDANDPDMKPKGVTKQAMDAALANQAAKLRKEWVEMDEAKREVRPYVGEITVAMDSAAAVYRFALTEKGIDTKGVPDAGLRAMVGMLSLAKDSQPPRQRVTGNDEFYKTFTTAARLRG